MKKEELLKVLYAEDTLEAHQDILKLEKMSDAIGNLYFYFDELEKMLMSDETYIWLRGYNLICKQAKWDSENKINKIIDKLLDKLDNLDWKVLRKCLQSLNIILLYKSDLSDVICKKIKELNCSIYDKGCKCLIERDINYLLTHIN